VSFYFEAIAQNKKFCNNFTWSAICDRRMRSREKFLESGAKSSIPDDGHRGQRRRKWKSSSVEIAHSSGTVETFMVPCIAVPVRCAGNWITVSKYQLRKTSVHALTTSYVLTYDDRSVNAYATGSRWIWVARLTLIVFTVFQINYFSVPLFAIYQLQNIDDFRIFNSDIAK